MVRRISALAIAVATGAGALTFAQAVPASAEALAAPTVSDVRVSPGAVVVGRFPATARFSFTTTGSAENVTLQVRAPGIGVGSQVKLDSRSLGGGRTAWWGSKSFDTGSPAGTWTLLAVASNKDGENSKNGEFKVVQSRDTRIAGFRVAPQTVRKGADLSVAGRLQIQDGSRWEGHRGQRVNILFKADDSRRWERVTTDRTDGFGGFRATVPAKSSGWWKAEYDGGFAAKGSESDGERVRVIAPPQKAASRIVKFDALREPAKRGRDLFFKGTLEAAERFGWDGHRAPVRLFFKADGSSSWQSVKTVWTGRDGDFTTKATAWRSGEWRAVFAGDGETRGSTSARDHVRVVR
ncbi:hypothetical protein Misp01_33190 [Microtetraspora sp. NBRC 13810]|uniref:hypothetical protein n=1 Tax=Microtetraspora sp. NBRC 13810 TaxID=3030990 RepID=UPI00249FA484|nr:hypothetical protein [Microtetraspora sp. NBRC 13810]GLW08189.1 hypothetical protein Misp01_33190 [Microtetraspora sp. NBRC 13810]